MTAASLKAARDSRIGRATRQELSCHSSGADRNYVAAARWDRVYLRALAILAKEAA